jgi:exodeoxyribonuclease VII small subunit
MMKTKASSKTVPAAASVNQSLVDFESSLQELERIVTQMEQGQLSLEQSLDAFEQGVRLTRTCQETLRQAEQRVNVLIQKESDDYALRPLHESQNG